MVKGKRGTKAAAAQKETEFKSAKVAATKEAAAAKKQKKNTEAVKGEEEGDVEVAWEDAEFDEFMDSFMLRGKGLLDGCDSLEAVVKRLRDAADAWESKLKEGFVLKGTFDGDVGLVVHPDGRRLFEYLYEDPEQEGKKKATSGKKKSLVTAAKKRASK